MLRTVSETYAKLLTLCGLIAGFAIAAMAVMITLNVILRSLSITNFPWLLEVSEYILYIGTFLAAPWALRLGAHVRVDIVLGLMPGLRARAISMIADLLGLFFCALLLRHGWRVAWTAFDRGDVLFKEIIIPEWPLLVIIPLSAAMLCIEFLRRLLYPDVEPADTDSVTAIQDGR